jgi:subtilisin family serine protease
VIPVVLISLPNAVFAEIEQTQEVVQDSYIIVPKSAVSAAGAIVSGSIDSRKIANFKLKVNRSLGGKQVLLSRSNAANEDVLNEETVIAYRAEDDKCPALLASGAVEECSPNYRIHVETTPDDPKMGELWGMSALHGIDATGAWNVSTGSEEVVVAIIDTGIDYTHPDLAANIWTNPLEIPGNGRDDDNDGVVDDIHGANFTTRDTSGRPVPSGDPKDDHLHGTHVAGTIGGVGNNHLGVAGVNWNVKMMGLKFLDKNGSGSLSDAISAINLMVKLKKRGVNIRVSNNSWGGGGYAAALYSAIRDARDAGIIFVAAAGNSASDNDARASYPANYDLSNVVSVAAIDVEQNLASFSNYGATQVDIAAPGVNIYSTVPGGYATLSGTSMATPHVTGALALLLANEPNLSADQAIARLYDTGSRIASLEGVVRTGRKLNARKLLLKSIKHGLWLLLPFLAATPSARFSLIQTKAG